MDPATAEALDLAAARLARAERLLVGTGAGMSTESGIPTYRRPGSTSWSNYGAFERLGVKAEDLACPQAFEEDPARAWGFFEWKRRVVAAAAPHAGYLALHRLAARVPASFVQTSNVDGLHLRAGWPAERLHEVHGSMWRLQCSGPCSRHAWPEPRVPLVDLDEVALVARAWPRCPACGRSARPHVLMFADLDYVGDAPAEAARARFHARGEEHRGRPGPDVFVIVGESGVIPTHVHDANLLRRAHGTFVVSLNPDPTSKAARVADVHLSLGAQQGLVALLDRAECKIGRGARSRS